MTRLADFLPGLTQPIHLTELASVDCHYNFPKSGVTDLTIME